MVRRFVGYQRHHGVEDVQRLNELYRWVRLYVNFFMPSRKLREKGREGSPVGKRHDPARTPCQRVLDSETVCAKDKRKLRAQYRKLNPAALHRRIQGLRKTLLERPGRHPEQVFANTPRLHPHEPLPDLPISHSELAPTQPPGP